MYFLQKDKFQPYAGTEVKKDFAILAKLNSFKETIDKKKQLIRDLDTTINNLEEERKSV